MSRVLFLIRLKRYRVVLVFDFLNLRFARKFLPSILAKEKRGDKMRRLILIFSMLGFGINSHAETITYNDYHAEIIRIIDGDTFEARISIFPKQTATHKIRLRLIDTPELNGDCNNEKNLARKAKLYLQTILPKGSIIRLHHLDYDSFGRVLATASHQEYGDIGALMLQQNLAMLYQKGERNYWCTE